MSILLTSGTGYIDSHTCVELLNAGYKLGKKRTWLDCY
jgi:UDP-glucose 4-epimerase